MIELKGKYESATVFTDLCESEAISQIINLLNQPFMASTHPRFMPDVHAGKGCTVGTTMHIKDKVCPNLVGVDIGCLDCDTEILTESGWIKISEYKDNEKILQFDPVTNIGMFIKPQLYIKKKCDWFYHFKNSKGLDQMISEEHNILMYYGHKNRKINYKTIKPEFLINLDDKKLSKNYYMFNTTFNIKNKGIEISDEMIRIDIMIQADGRIKEYEDYNFVELHFKKEHKILRAENLLKKANITYNKYSSKDTTFISFRVPKYINKNLKKYWKANYEQLKIVAEESLLWDGHLGYRSFYSSSNKDSIDVIQFAFIATDVRASLYNVKNTEYWSVIPTKNKYVGYNKKPKIVKSKDGYKYCFKTDTGFFLCRRNGYTFLTGNCGMLTIKLDETDIDFAKLDALLNDGKTMPSGFNKREVAHRNLAHTRINELTCLNYIDLDTAEKSLGSLGGGNHFLEIDKSEDNTFYLVIHTGSRHLGIDVCNYHQKRAINACKTQDAKELIAKLKSEGKTKEIQAELNKLTGLKVPDDLAYLTGNGLNDYLHDMKITQEYAVWNRKTIAEEIIKAMNWKIKSDFTTIHNYIDTDDMILRKGAISAKKNEIVLIPLSMRDGAIIAKGLGNPEWNSSAPHGAGRLMSRSKAKEILDVNEFAKQMQGVYTTCVGEATLDEAPDAYKPAESIIENIKDTVEILEVIKPIYNFKAH